MEVEGCFETIPVFHGWKLHGCTGICLPARLTSCSATLLSHSEAAAVAAFEQLMIDWDDAFADDCANTEKAALMARLAEEGHAQHGRGGCSGPAASGPAASGMPACTRSQPALLLGPASPSHWTLLPAGMPCPALPSLQALCLCAAGWSGTHGWSCAAASTPAAAAARDSVPQRSSRLRRVRDGLG